MPPAPTDLQRRLDAIDRKLALLALIAATKP
jgi:hypothetical protein